MEGQLAVPFHFAAEFLILAVSVGACLDSLRRARAGGGWSASIQTLGFAVLAGAQILHGARISGAADDGSAVSVFLRAAAFALVALGSRSVTDTPLGMGGIASFLPVAAVPGLFLPGGSSQLALIPGVAAAAAAWRGVTAHRRDQDPASFAFAAAFATFAAGEVALAISPPAGGTTLAVAHALRFAGALLLSRWLASSIARSVRLRFVAAFVVALTILVLVLSAALNGVIAGNLADQELNRINVTANARLGALRNRQDVDKQTVLNLARATQGRLPDRFALSALACLYPDQDFLMTVRTDRRVVAAVGKPKRQCDFTDVGSYVQRNPSPPIRQDLRLGVAGTEVVTGVALAGRTGASFEVLPGLMVSVAAAPIGPLNRPVGALIAGRVIDTRALLRERGQTAGSGEARADLNDLSLIVGGEVVATTLQGGIRGAGGLVTPARRIREVVEENQRPLNMIVDIGGVQSFVSYLSLQRSNGVSLGVFAVSTPQAGIRESQRALNRVLFLIALAGAAVASVIASAAGRRVTRPIHALTLAAEAVRRGDLTARAPVETPDELGELGKSFNEMAASLDRSTADLRAAAVTEGDLRGQMEAIMQSMGDALIATDTQGCVVTVNRAAERLTGIVAGAALGRPLADVVRGVDAAGNAIAESALTDPSLIGTIHRGTSQVPVAITAAPLQDAHGANSGRVIVLRDVSAETQAEKMKSEFLSNVSHELRTPLTPIKGYTEILRRKKFPKEKAEAFLDGILESTARLERIVEILVDFAAMEAGRLKPQTEPVDVRSFVAGVLERWKGRGGGRFTLRIPQSLPPVEADRRLLTKSLEELLDNAVKFSPGQPRVEVEASAVSNGSRSRRASAIRIAVKDKGMGISADQMPSLFRDFQQLDGSETREHGGLGLGLAYVKRVAGVHGGVVAAESQPGKGSTFSLTLPVADTKSKAPTAKKRTVAKR